MNKNSKTKIIPIVFILIGILSLSVFVIDKYEIYNNQKSGLSFNHIGNIILGIEPTTYTRLPTMKDIDTQLNIKVGDSVYRLFESRSLEKFDYGKTFVVKVA
jgi:hypothetical protein